MIIDQKRGSVEINVDKNKSAGFTVALSPKTFELISSGIYTYKKRAVIREIACNCHDAHIEAGNTDPFDVHLPTRLEPWISFRDYGMGLSDEDMMNLYTGYFQSTKTNSNELTGAFGLGSKSPFCMVDSFNVTSYYDGFKSCYTCYKDEEGMPQICQLSSVECDEPCGLEVQLAVKRYSINDFCNEAVNVLKWFPVTPNINIVEIQDHLQEQIDSEHHLYNETYGISVGHGKVYALMGNVAYRINSKSDYGGPLYGLEGFIRFDMGSLTVDAGRENIEQTNHNDTIVDARVEECLNACRADISAEIELQTTTWHIAKEAKKHRKIAKLLNMNLTKFGLKVDSKVKRPSITVYFEVDGRVKKDTLTYPNDIFEYDLYRTKARCLHRVRNAVRNGDTRNIAMIDPINAILMGVPTDELKNTDTLPIPHKETSSGEKRVVRKVFTFNRCSSGKMDAWSEHSEDFTDLDVERVYVELNRWDVVGIGKGSMYTLFTGINLIRKSCLSDKVNIYGLRKKFINSEDFIDGNWIELREYAEREFRASERRNCIKFEESSGIAIKMKKLGDKDSCLDERFGVFATKFGEYSNGSSSVADNCYDLLGIKRSQFSLDGLYTELMEAYPLLVHSNEYDAVVGDFVEYVNCLYGSKYAKS